MTRCPSCATAWQAGQVRCECEYDPARVSTLEHELKQWRRVRHVAIATWFAGFARTPKQLPEARLV